VDNGNNCLKYGLQDKPGKEEKKGAKKLAHDDKSEAGRTEVSQGSRRSIKQVVRIQNMTQKGIMYLEV
jgi:hypothetical protein